MSTPNYIDNQVPIGSRVEDLKRGPGAGTAVASYVFENITLNRPSQVVRRRDEIGRPNGFTITDDFCEGSATVQIATAATETPKLGDWFSDTFDGKVGATAEQWVISSVGQPYSFQDYYKVNVNIIKSDNPPAS